MISHHPLLFTSGVVSLAFMLQALSVAFFCWIPKPAPTGWFTICLPRLVSSAGTAIAIVLYQFAVMHARFLFEMGYRIAVVRG